MLYIMPSKRGHNRQMSLRKTIAVFTCCSCSDDHRLITSHLAAKEHRTPDVCPSIEEDNRAPKCDVTKFYLWNILILALNSEKAV